MEAIMAKQLKKRPVTWRAVVQRVNRRLAHDGEMLRADRSSGEHYIVDIQRNAVTAQHVDVEELGRELGVIRPWEEVVS
jgi:hypothetical protein